MRTSRPPLRDESVPADESVACDEPLPCADVYDDARALAADYPIAYLPQPVDADPVDADPVAVDVRWRALIDEMVQHPELSGRYGD